MSWIKQVGDKISGGVNSSVNDFVHAVQNPVETFNNAVNQLQTWRNNVANLNPAGASEELWGEGGRFAYAAAAAVMAKRSPTGESPSKRYMNILRVFAGDRVNKVTLHWGTPPLDEWAADSFRIKLSDVDTEAQTYGYDIYIRDQKGARGELDELTTLGHELVHVEQFEKYGSSYSNFGYHYFKGYKQSGMNYFNIPIEQEAYARHGAIEGRLKVLFQQPSSGNRAAYLQRVRDHAAGFLPQTGNGGMWELIHNSASNDTGATSGLQYLSRVRDHAEWLLIDRERADLWESIHRSALHDVGEA